MALQQISRTDAFLWCLGLLHMYTQTHMRINTAHAINFSNADGSIMAHNHCCMCKHAFTRTASHMFCLQRAWPSAVSRLRYASNELRNDLDIGLIAVKSNGLALDQAGQGARLVGRTCSLCWNWLGFDTFTIRCNKNIYKKTDSFSYLICLYNDIILYIIHTIRLYICIAHTHTRTHICRWYVAVFEAAQNWFRWRLWACDSAGFIPHFQSFSGGVCRTALQVSRQQLPWWNWRLVRKP